MFTNRETPNLIAASRVLKVAIRLFWKTTCGGLRVGSGIAPPCTPAPAPPEAAEGAPPAGRSPRPQPGPPGSGPSETGGERARAPTPGAAPHQPAHHRPGPPDGREGVARVGEVRLHVLRLPGLGALEDGREEVRGPHVVAGLHERCHRRPADLAPRPGHEYQHTALLLVANHD